MIAFAATVQYQDEGSPALISLPQVTQSNQGTVFTPAHIRVLQTIGTSEEGFNFVDVTDCRCLLIKNMSGINFVEIGFSTGVLPIRLDPGDVTLLPNIQTLFLKADTAACKVDILALNR
jgi:hypothetical protein